MTILKRMKVILFMIAGSLLLGIVFLLAFVWSVRNKQYDDNVTAANSILWDDDNPKSSKPIKQNS